MSEAHNSIPEFLNRFITFPNGTAWELLAPVTDFKHCHDGTPFEARVVSTCRQVAEATREPLNDDAFVMKIKVQAPTEALGDATLAESGPSTTTAAELKVLQSFRDAKLPSVPHLVASKREVQGPNGILPGGYITYTLMTMMPGKALLNLNYWSLPEEEINEIRTKFLMALRSIYALGVEPIDRGLRNVLWDRETRICSIIDFELWRETTASISDEKNEMQRWGLVRRPPARDWWSEWNIHTR